MTADALGGWSTVTNMQAGGGLYAQRIVSRMHYDLERAIGGFGASAEPETPSPEIGR